MSPAILLFFGACMSVAFAMLSAVWVPYADTGTSDAAMAHFSAAGGVILAILACFGYMAWQSTSSGATKSGKSYSQVVVGYFLVASAILTGLLFLATYAGLAYKVFWTVQIIQYCSLLGIWIVAEYAGRSSDARDGTARVTGFRKEKASDELEQLTTRLSSLGSGEAKALLNAVSSVKDELRFLPVFADGPAAAEILPAIRAWTTKISDALPRLAQPLDTALPPDPQYVTLLEDGASLKRRIAGWKRS